ncbi:hypothetical protein Rt10032_c11g4532 [Rhodotorula toruloides]|uniref:Uncharacterized protein n=1 Tax=Rhodotorula toruloides TaxID=5286 RepID=A0A511KKQ4_RHOTO|nr:hypothetical protein Rt10032_c11g4532 [Rhodotorula toruloides]
MSTPGATFSNPSTPSRRYTPATGSAGYTFAASRRRRGRFLLLVGLLALVVLLTIIIVPPSVVLTRKNKNNLAEGQQVVTTVVDGSTETRTRDGVVATRTRLTTLANGQASTVTSFVALPDVTVSATTFVTTTLTDGLVVVARTATNLQTEVATVTFTAGRGQVGTRTITLTSLDIVTPSLFIQDDSLNDDSYEFQLDIGIGRLEQRLVLVLIDSPALFLALHLDSAHLHNVQYDNDFASTSEHDSFILFVLLLLLQHLLFKLLFVSLGHCAVGLVYCLVKFELDLFHHHHHQHSTHHDPCTKSGSTSRSSSTSPPPTSAPGSNTSSSRWYNPAHFFPLFCEHLRLIHRWFQLEVLDLLSHCVDKPYEHNVSPKHTIRPLSLVYHDSASHHNPLFLLLTHHDSTHYNELY